MLKSSCSPSNPEIGNSTDSQKWNGDKLTTSANTDGSKNTIVQTKTPAGGNTTTTTIETKPKDLGGQTGVTTPQQTTTKVEIKENPAPGGVGSRTTTIQQETTGADGGRVGPDRARRARAGDGLSGH